LYRKNDTPIIDCSVYLEWLIFVDFKKNI